MRVSIESDKCIGCGVCIQICPNVFSLDEAQGVARVLRPEGSECVEEARDSCPVSCIVIDV